MQLNYMRKKRRLSLPKVTLGELGTELNRKVFDEGREDLEPLREEVRSGLGPGPTKPIALSPQQQSEANELLKERANRQDNIADDMQANIFGDTQKQSQMASNALSGFMSDPGTAINPNEEEIIEKHRNRSAMSRRIDESLNAEIADSPDQWLNDPSEYDWPGIDTK